MVWKIHQIKYQVKSTTVRTVKNSTYSSLTEKEHCENYEQTVLNENQHQWNTLTL